ncbi:MAG: HEPN domain-containing protein [Eubacterium sp.]|nr:HEPN domain-containing protein [Eubacterium sp.]
MDDKNNKDLARVRIDRAEELLDEAKSLLENGSYKSANNRAYYSFEKSIKAILALKGVDAKTHSGVIHLFNTEYIKSSDYFSHDDYDRFKKIEIIRGASDYDDFYVANKEECIEQVESAEYILKKVKNYIER